MKHRNRKRQKGQLSPALLVSLAPSIAHLQTLETFVHTKRTTPSRPKHINTDYVFFIQGDTLTARRCFAQLFDKINVFVRNVSRGRQIPSASVSLPVRCLLQSGYQLNQAKKESKNLFRTSFETYREITVHKGTHHT